MPIVTSPAANGSRAEQLINTKDKINTKWFSLQNNILDGSFHPIAADGSSDVGYISAQLSDINGYLNPAVTITITDISLVVPSFQIESYLYGAFLKDFTVKAYTNLPVKTTIVDATVVNNTEQIWKVNFNSLKEINEIELTVTRIGAANKSVWMTELGTLFEILRSDTLNLNFTEDVEISPLIPKFSSDILLVSGNLEADLITAELFSSDTLRIAIQDKSKMHNIHTLMDGHERQVFCKVEIIYTNPNFDADIVVTTEGTAYGTDMQNLTDSIDTPKYKWFSLTNNKLDGTHHPIDSRGLYSSGWWGTKISDAQGYFSAPEVVELTFTPRPLDILRVDGDDKLDVYPVDFEYRVYADEVLLHTEVVEDNTEVHWSKLVDLDNVTKIVLSITRINKSNENLKLMEILSSVKEDYTRDELVFVNLLEEIVYPTASVSLGVVSSNEIDIALSNTDDKFTFNNTQSRLFNKLKKNRKVRVWFGAEISPDNIEWYPYGVFWTTEWNVPTASLIAYATARDRLNLLNTTDFDSSVLYLNNSVYDLFLIILDDAGLTPEEYYVDPVLQDIILPKAWFTRMTHREALQHLAGCCLVNIYCARDGKLIIKDVSPTPTVMANYLDDTNVYEKEFPLAWADVANYIETRTTKVTLEAQSEIFSLKEAIEVPAQSELEVSYAYNTEAATNIQAPVIVADVGISVKTFTPYCWGFTVVLQNTALSSGYVTEMSVDGQIITTPPGTIVVAKDDALIRHDGKVKATIEHPFIQDFSYAQQLSIAILERTKVSKQDIVIQGRGDIAVVLGDRIKTDTFNGYTEGMVIRQDTKWDGSLQVETYLKKI